MRAAARRCGYSELDGPSLESLDLFKIKSGEEIGRQIWSFTDKGGREVALIPETTPTLARIFVDRAKSEPLPAKWFTVSRLWRYEEPQAGRTREFAQFNLDVLGVPGIEAEVDVLSSASLLLDAIGAEGLYGFRLNDRGLAEGLGRHFGARDINRYFYALDHARRLSSREFFEALNEAGVPGQGAESLQALLSSAGTGVPAAEVDAFLDGLTKLKLPQSAEDGIDRLRRIFRHMIRIDLGDRMFLDPAVVRGLAYYTSTVFEAFDRHGDLRALFGGGRYDKLIELFGGPPTPACGLAIGDQTLELLLKAHERWPAGEPPLDTYVVAVTEEEIPRAFELVEKLRRAGVSADCDLMARSLSRQLKEADRRRARRAIILGPKETARGVVVEREMSSGSQRERAWHEVLKPG
jgi:histidyl-tRNA synthetase